MLPYDAGAGRAAYARESRNEHLDPRTDRWASNYLAEAQRRKEGPVVGTRKRLVIGGRCVALIESAAAVDWS